MAMVIIAGYDILSFDTENIYSSELNDFCSGHFCRKFEEQRYFEYNIFL